MKTFKLFEAMKGMEQEDHLVDEHLFDDAGYDRDDEDRDEDHATAHRTGQLIWNEHTHSA